jgi:peptidoglycan/xylan/chitin deacetylase (PgdA/CDA1 family)
MRRAERLLRGLEALGADRFLRTWFGGRGVIFVLHRAAAAGSQVLDPDMTTTTDLLDGALRLAKSEGYACIPLDDVPARLRGPQSGRFAVFTFDDGYRDNLISALPVFRDHKVPFCVYVTTGMIERTLDYWWGALERLITFRDRLDLEPLGLESAAVTASWPEKQATFARLQSWVHDDLEARVSTVMQWCATQGVDSRAVLDDDALSWHEVRELAADPLVTIGAHSVTHRRMARLDDADLRHELIDARATIERELKRPVRHLAYPYGGAAACGPREFRLASEAGYVTAVTTQRGNLFAEHAAHATALPRRRFTEGTPSLRTVRRGLTGTDWLMRRGVRVVVP